MGGDKYPLAGRTLVVLRTVPLAETGQIVTTVQVEALRKDERQVPQAAPSF